MGLSKQAIKEFKEIYYQEFGERLSDKQALDMAEGLISLFRVIYRPLPESDQGGRKEENNPRCGKE